MDLEKRKLAMIEMREGGYLVKDIGFAFNISGSRVCDIIGNYGRINKKKQRKIKRLPTDIRFLKKVMITDSCWEWSGATCGSGDYKYGRMNINYKQVYAHRYSYEYFIGKIPIGMVVCHKCDNPLCVNPHHLFVGTQEDNMIDRDNKKRGKNGYGLYKYK